MKQFIRYFLSIVFFLLAGSANIYANPHQKESAIISNAVLLHLSNVDYTTQLNRQAVTIKDLPVSPQKRNDRIYAEESEEESHIISFFKKQVEVFNNNYFLDRYAQSSESYHSYLTKRLPTNGEHFLFYSSTRYLVLQVIRI